MGIEKQARNSGRPLIPLDRHFHPIHQTATILGIPAHTGEIGVDGHPSKLDAAKGNV